MTFGRQQIAAGSKNPTGHARIPAAAIFEKRFLEKLWRGAGNRRIES
jgi:hypothetical protein